MLPKEIYFILLYIRLACAHQSLKKTSLQIPTINTRRCNKHLWLPLRVTKIALREVRRSRPNKRQITSLTYLALLPRMSIKPQSYKQSAALETRILPLPSLRLATTPYRNQRRSSRQLSLPSIQHQSHPRKIPIHSH